jgi:hypothetical protein
MPLPLTELSPAAELASCCDQLIGIVEKPLSPNKKKRANAKRLPTTQSSTFKTISMSFISDDRGKCSSIDVLAVNCELIAQARSPKGQQGRSKSAYTLCSASLYSADSALVRMVPLSAVPERATAATMMSPKAMECSALWH